MRILDLLLILMACTFLGAGEDAAPAGKRVVYMGNYKYHPGRMAAMLQAIDPAWRVDKRCKDIHAGLDMMWHGKVARDGKVLVPGEVGKAEILGEDGKGKAAVVLLQMPLKAYFDRRGGEKITSALKAYRELAAQVGARVVILADAGTAMVNPPMVDAEALKKLRKVDTVEAFAAQRDKEHAEAERLLKQLLEAEQGIEVVPLHRVFRAYYEAHPDENLHAPRNMDDSHHNSPRDSYVVACAVAAVVGGGAKPETFPTSEQLYAWENTKIANENKKNAKKQGYEPKPLIAIPDEERRQIEAVVWGVLGRR